MNETARTKASDQFIEMMRTYHTRQFCRYCQRQRVFWLLMIFPDGQASFWCGHCRQNSTFNLDETGVG